MNRLGTEVRRQRKALGLSQVELSSAARVSLATVQKLEAGRANPSLHTLQRLLGPLGYDLELARVEAQWDALSALGLPLTAEAPVRIRPTEAALRKHLLLAAMELAQVGDTEETARKRESLQALLLALETHFPSRYRAWVARSSVLSALASAEPSGRLIKLSRMARQRLAEYL